MVRPRVQTGVETRNSHSSRLTGPKSSEAVRKGRRDQHLLSGRVLARRMTGELHACLVMPDSQIMLDGLHIVQITGER